MIWVKPLTRSQCFQSLPHYTVFYSIYLGTCRIAPVREGLGKCPAPQRRPRNRTDTEMLEKND